MSQDVQHIQIHPINAFVFFFGGTGSKGLSRFPWAHCIPDLGLGLAVWGLNPSSFGSMGKVPCKVFKQTPLQSTPNHTKTKPNHTKTTTALAILTPAAKMPSAPGVAPRLGGGGAPAPGRAPRCGAQAGGRPHRLISYKTAAAEFGPIQVKGTAIGPLVLNFQKELF